MKVTEMAKVMGSKWKELSADEKQKYVDMAAEDKARYQREKAAWDLQHPEQAEAKRARTDFGPSDAAIAAPAATAAPAAPMSAASAPTASQLCDVL